MIYTNPLYGFLRTLSLFITGRVKFDKSVTGSIIKMQDGRSYCIFRRVIIGRIIKKNRKAEALFIVRFKPKIAIKKNIRLIYLRRS